MVCSWRRISRYARLVGFMAHPGGMDMHWAVLLGRDLGRSMNPSRWDGGSRNSRGRGDGTEQRSTTGRRLVQCIGVHGGPFAFRGLQHNDDTLQTPYRWTVVRQHHNIRSTSTGIGRSLVRRHPYVSQHMLCISHGPTPSRIRIDQRQPLASTNVYSEYGQGSRLCH